MDRLEVMMMINNVNGPSQTGKPANQANQQTSKVQTSKPAKLANHQQTSKQQSNQKEQRNQKKKIKNNKDSIRQYIQRGRHIVIIVYHNDVSKNIS